ncbi:hypothetical protein HT585_31460 [Ensifer sp. HO-A22]|uniref:Uncharacterized protein n=1 Tax=Ensifer oleiphilus TaxID=2742698 RepID=A0A7Y6URB4_9HYPH|nr:hypothetical protein [Ensifer oleiphilus]NVD43381.1 hypothetical protein [Ensifer oleiphilus]
MVDYPGFNYKSMENLQAFSQVGSPDVVTFGIQFEESRSPAELLAYKLDWYGKQTVPHKASASGLLEFETKATSTSPFENNDVFAAEIGEEVVLDCSPNRAKESPRCQMNFEWKGFLVTAGFSRERLPAWKNIKEKITKKLNCWQKNTNLNGECSAER